MSKILLIGQAPAAVKQKVPYDTTMLYDWLAECGISKEKAQEIFEFEAVYDKFPGYTEGGGHKAPCIAQMDEHWSILGEKIKIADKVIILGNTARDYIHQKMWTSTEIKDEIKVLYLIHPSRMNYNRYMKNKESIISSLKSFINN